MDNLNEWRSDEINLHLVTFVSELHGLHGYNYAGYIAKYLPSHVHRFKCGLIVKIMC